MTPDSIWDGGHVPGARIFDIKAFGSGQEHSLSPSVNHSDVLVSHAFGGSSELKGASWVTEGI